MAAASLPRRAPLPQRAPSLWSKMCLFAAGMTGAGTGAGGRMDRREGRSRHARLTASLLGRICHALHRVRLSSAGLAIRKDRPVKSL